LPASLTLFVPGLLQRLCERNPPECPSLPTLQRVMSRARASAFPTDSANHALLQLFGCGSSAAVATAALSRLGDGVAPDRAADGDGDGGHWLRADPVHLYTDRDRLLLFDARQLDIQQQEADAIGDHLASFFDEDGMQLYTPRPDRWYLHLPATPSLQTSALEQVSGRDLLQYMPGGEQGGEWRRRLNEVQMLLFEHAINQRREQHGRPTINSLWFWGNGELPAAPKRRFTQVYSDHPVGLGLARLTSTPTERLPDGAGQWLEHFADNGDAQGEYLIQLDAIRDAHTLGSATDWSHALTGFEQHWLRPLLTAVSDRHLSRLRLIPANQRQYQIDRATMRRWWRRSHPYSSYLQPVPRA